MLDADSQQLVGIKITGGFYIKMGIGSTTGRFAEGGGLW